MKTLDASESFQTARAYIYDHFEPQDRLAIVIVNRRTRSATQRLASAEAIASPEFQSWLRDKNAQQYEIYISMNALHANARGREKEDVENVRHVYLDLDHDAAATVQELLR